MWTNVARTNIAGTNVTVTVKSVQDGPRNLSISLFLYFLDAKQPYDDFPIANIVHYTKI